MKSTRHKIKIGDLVYHNLKDDPMFGMIIEDRGVEQFYRYKIEWVGVDGSVLHTTNDATDAAHHRSKYLELRKSLGL